jgi:[acyl-carrier-protein] S-malonyltransferase
VTGLALLFSPQGSQVVGMGRELAEGWESARAVYREADEALDWPVSILCWNGPEDRLNDTRQTQPCLLATSLACLAALREAAADAGTELAPLLVAGHSVGEYAALVAAGVLSPGDALRLVALRGELMASASAEGGMIAVMGLERDQVAQIVAKIAPPDELVVANDNAPGQVVISGTQAALAATERELRAAGARRAIPLRVSGAFHSPLMAATGEALSEAFAEVEWRDADPPIVSNVTAAPVREASSIRKLLARQVSSAVEWVASVQSMLEAGVDTFVECGPGAALTGMVRRIAPDATVLNVSNARTLHATLTALAERDWTREAAFAGMSSPGSRSGAGSSGAGSSGAASSSAASSGGAGASS